MKNINKNTMPFAVIAIARTPDGRIAATTRPNEPGRIGLPGGKLDEGETPLQAILRECQEEGWQIDIPRHAEPAHIDVVDGHILWWYVSPSEAIQLAEFKEKGRLEPLAVTYEEIANAGYGNEWMFNYDMDSLFRRFNIAVMTLRTQHRTDAFPGDNNKNICRER